MRVSKKCWHMLVNLCLHILLTCAVFVGGINQTYNASVCQAVCACFSVYIQSLGDNIYIIFINVSHFIGRTAVLLSSSHYYFENISIFVVLEESSYVY